MPICLAVLRLIISSNFCDWTGGRANNNDIDFKLVQFGQKMWKTLGRPFGPASLNDDAFTFDIPRVAQTLTECFEIGGRDGRRCRTYETDSGDFRWILRLSHSST